MKDVRDLASKLALVGLGLVLALFLLEMGLRFGGWWWEYAQSQRNAIAPRSAASEEDFVILFLGESTTAFGGAKSYPRLVKELLGGRMSGRAVRVVNAGKPGISTDDILDQANHLLAENPPDLVVSMMGINDPLVPARKARSAITNVFEDLRVVKLARLLSAHLKSRGSATGDGHEALTTTSASPHKADQHRPAFSGEDSLRKQEKKLHDLLEQNPAAGNARVKYLQVLIALGNNQGACLTGLEVDRKVSVPDAAYLLAAGACRALGVKSLREGRNEAAVTWFTHAIGVLSEEPKFDVLRGQVYLQIAEVQDVQENFGAAGLLRERARHFAWEGFSLRTQRNYLELARIVRESGAQLVAVQYPMRKLQTLRELLRQDESIVFVDNGPSFRAAVRRLGFWEVFRDQFAGDFGHMTLTGRRLLASNVAGAIGELQREKIIRQNGG